MEFSVILENLSNPALLFFFLGILSVRFKSSLTVPDGASRFISVYLLFSIGFKGGQELSHGSMNLESMTMILAGLLSAVVVPILSFLLLRRKLGNPNAAAISAAYGSVSAVTFITAVSFLDQRGLKFGGHMVALMAMMEAPAIIVGTMMLKLFSKEGLNQSLGEIFKYSLTNGSVFLLIGSTIIGFLSSETQAQGIAPFTTDIFKGFLALFLLDMGIRSGKTIGGLWTKGITPIAYSLFIPLLLGILVSYGSQFFDVSTGDRLLLTVLVASASYIAVPAAMKLAIPDADPGLYTPMALAITFPMNITIGIPIYYGIIESTLS